MRLAIQGSRTLYNSTVRDILKHNIKIYKPDLIITSGELAVRGATGGVCAVAYELCQDMKIPSLLYWLEREKYAGGAWEHRSKKIQEASDHILFLWDGASVGTSNEIKLAEKKRKGPTYKIIQLEVTIEIKTVKEQRRSEHIN